MVNRLDPLLGANAERGRSHVWQVVLGPVRRTGPIVRTDLPIVRADPPIVRADLGRAAGLGNQTARDIIRDRRDGLSEQRGQVSAGRGLPAIRHAPDPSGGFALGVNLRPRAVVAVLLDPVVRPAFRSCLTLRSPAPGAVTAAVVALCDRALAGTGIPPVRSLGTRIGIGIGIGTNEQAVAMLENLSGPGSVILCGAIPDSLRDEPATRLPLPLPGPADRPDRLDRPEPRPRRGAPKRTTAARGGASLLVDAGFDPQFAVAA